MPDQNMPNDASRKGQAEGERWDSDNELDNAAQRTGYSSDEQGAGITNRPLDEEIDNQQAVPDRGRSKPGAHAGHGDKDTGGVDIEMGMDMGDDERRSER